MSEPLVLPKERLAAFCRQWSITQLALFGSALREDFGPESDVDVLASFDPAARHSLFDLVRMQEQLGDILGRKVDLVSRRGLEQSRNYLRRRAILESAEVVYGA